MTAAYPLTWPDHIPRQKYRESGRFKTTLAGALLAELEKTDE